MTNQHKMCLDKRVYIEESEARRVANTLGLRPYRCPRCKAFHLTSKNTQKRSLTKKAAEKREKRIEKQKNKNMTDKQKIYSLKVKLKNRDSKLLCLERELYLINSHEGE